MRNLGRQIQGCGFGVEVSRFRVLGFGFRFGFKLVVQCWRFSGPGIQLRVRG